MLTPSQQTCEVKVDEAWHLATLTEVRSRHMMAQKRCPACHGQVIFAGNYIGTGHLKLQHRRVHTGCPLKPKTYSGTSSLHPQALA
jgi:hypothetical protein